MSAAQDVRGQLGETGTVARVRHVFRFGGHAADEPPNVCHADGFWEIRKHRRVVGRITYVERSRELLARSHLETAREEVARRDELVVIAEPAVDMDRADGNVKALTPHQLRDALSGFDRQRCNLLGIVDGEIGFAIALVGSEDAARNCGDYGPGNAGEPLTI